ncbi:MAG: hypothetical protein LUC85_03155 [Bacteroidales bacterium]|nr:hypothetical protein [Bacteroidales bacterium]
MLKANVTITGTVAKPASVLTTHDGKKFVVLYVTFPVPGSRQDQEGKTVQARVSFDGDEAMAAKFTPNMRVKAIGTLEFKKRGDTIFYNLDCESCPVAVLADETDGIDGTLTFRVTVGSKGATERQTKKGDPMLMFSAFSAEKLKDDSFEYIWLNCIGFDMAKPAWLQPKVRVEGNGKLVLDVYNGNVNIGCRLTELKQYIKPDYYGQ